MAKKSGRFVWQFVIGLGFLSGIWTAIGLDPEDVLINAVGTAINSVYPSSLIRYLFLILPTILLAVSIIGGLPEGKRAGTCLGPYRVRGGPCDPFIACLGSCPALHCCSSRVLCSDKTPERNRVTRRICAI